MKIMAVILVIAVLIAGFFVGRNLILKTILENAVRAISGLTLFVESIEVGVFKNYIRVKNLVLFNPPAFSDRIMFAIGLLYIEYDAKSLFSNRIRLKRMDLYLEELTVVKDIKGVVNLNSLNVIKSEKTGHGARMPAIGIDKLHLKAGKVLYKDYTHGSSPKVTEFIVDLDERYENIGDPYALGCLIVSRSLYKTAVSRLAGFDMSLVQDKIANMASASVRTLDETSQNLAAISSEMTQKTTSALAQTPELFKKIIPIPDRNKEGE